MLGCKGFPSSTGNGVMMAGLAMMGMMIGAIGAQQRRDDYYYYPPGCYGYGPGYCAPLYWG